jgi:hypothetical protein
MDFPYDYVSLKNPSPDLGQAQQCGGVKPINGISTLPSLLKIDL